MIIHIILSAIHRPRLHRHPRGHSGHGRVPAVVLPLLLHDDQPCPLLNLQAGVDKASIMSLYLYIHSIQRCPDLHGLHAGREARVDAAPPQDPHRLQRCLLPPGSAHVLEGVTPPLSSCLHYTKSVTGRDSPVQSVRQQMLLLPTATLTH